MVPEVRVGAMVLDLLVPERCASCGGDPGPFCEACEAELWVLGPPLCERCGAPVAFPVRRCRECAGQRLPFASARAAVVYAGPAVALVSAWKERGRRSLADTAARIVTTNVERPSVDVLAAVPAVRERQLWRGENPALTLASALGARWEIPVVQLLERRGAAPRQRGLGRKARRRNVCGAFRAIGVPPRRIGLVDDVLTTGATVGSAAVELRRSGALHVEVVTFARALRDGPGTFSMP